MALTDEDKVVIETMIGTGVAGAIDTMDLASPIKKAIDESLGELREQIGTTSAAQDQLAAKLESLGKNPEPKKGDEKPDPMASINDAIGKLAEQVTSLVTERETDKARSTATQLVDRVLGEKRPNLKGRDVIAQRIAAKNPQDEASVVAALDAELEYMKSIGVDVEQLSADPDKEGAKEGASSTVEERVAQVMAVKPIGA